MTRTNETLVIGMMLTAMVLGGCGTDMASTVSAVPASSAGAVTAANRANPGDQALGKNRVPFAGVSLTDEQKAQLQAIAETYKPAQSSRTGLQALLTADTVDEAALRAALQTVAAERATHAEQEVAMRTEIRAVYTEAQRAEIVAKLQAQTERVASADQAPPADWEAKRAEREAAEAAKLGLTDEQKAAVAALKPQAPVTKPDPAARRQAEIAFWQTGDTSGLQVGAAPADQTEAIVKAALILTVDQRKVVFGRGFGGPDGGKGCHGGHERQGGPGKGGHGGRGPGGAPHAAADTAL